MLLDFRLRESKLLIALVLCLLLFSTWALGQETVPNQQKLQITVTDSSKQLIIGATCVLSQNKREAARAETNEFGVAKFSDLVAGNRYDLEVEKQGFEKYRQEITLSLDEPMHEIIVALAVSNVSAEITVENSSENANSVEAGSSPAAGNLQRKAIERLPLATKRVDEAIPLIPGVIRSSNGEISINGANEQQSAFRLNGLNVSDPSNGNFRLNLPVDAVETVQVFRHPYAAEFGQFTSGLTSIETRRGGEKWHFEVNDFLPDLRFVGGKIVGIRDDAPRVNFNGPIFKDKLFVSESLSYTISKVPVRGLLFPNNETLSEAISGFTQLDWILSPTHSETFTFGYFPERQSFIGLDFFRPRPVTANYKQKDFVAAFHDNFALEGGGLLQTSVSYKEFSAGVWGQGTSDHIFSPTGERGNYFATQDRRSSRIEFFETYDFPALRSIIGTNNLRTGFNFTRVSNWMHYSARPVNILRADGSLAERITFESAPEINTGNRTYAGFVQDRLIVVPNLSLDAGVRIEDQRIAGERNLAPRGGFAWSPFKDDKTIVRGGIGYFFDKIPLNIRAFSQYPVRTVVRFAGNGETVLSRVRFENLLVNRRSLFRADLVVPNPEIGFVPENLTWNLQVDRIVNSRLSLRANYTHSDTTNLYTLNPRVDFLGKSALVLSPSGRSLYSGLEFTAKLILPKNQPFYISYVRSKARGNLNDFNSYFGDFGSPILRQDEFSRLSTDVPNRFLAWGSIALPHKILLSPIWEWRSGFPYSVLRENQHFAGARNANGQRFPNFFSIDSEISKDFQVTTKYAVRLSLRGFNLTDHFNPRNVRNNLGDPQFGRFINSYRRYFTGGFDIIF